MSYHMGKKTKKKKTKKKKQSAYVKTRKQIICAVTAQLISIFVFDKHIVHCPSFS